MHLQSLTVHERNTHGGLLPNEKKDFLGLKVEILQSNNLGKGEHIQALTSSFAVVFAVACTLDVRMECRDDRMECRDVRMDYRLQRWLT